LTLENKINKQQGTVILFLW